MTFDEELQRAIDALGVRLREQAAAEVRQRVEEARREAEEAARQQIEQERASAAAEVQARAEADLRARLEQARAQAAEELQTRLEQLRAESAEEARVRVEAVRADTEKQVAARLQDVRTQAERDAQRQVDEARRQAAQEADARVHEAEARLELVRTQAAKDAEARVEEVRAEAARQVEVRAEQGRAQVAEAERLRRELEARLAAVSTGSDQVDGLREALRSLDQAGTLGGVLDALVESAGQQAGRAGVLLLRAGQLQGWRFAGFGAELDPPDALRLQFSEAGVLAAAARNPAPVTRGLNGHGDAPAFARLAAGAPCFAMPLTLSGEVVAVLYADAGVEAGPSERRELPSAALEILVRHAARCLEALTAFKAARAVIARGDATRSARSASPREDDDAEEGARRYARLLVSEIRLYHEAEVAEGRERRDLGTRLAAEIARARVLYEQRVPPDVRRRADYFHAELVRTLADGDARLLEASST